MQGTLVAVPRAYRGAGGLTVTITKAIKTLAANSQNFHRNILLMNHILVIYYICGTVLK